jgi:thiazole synthase
MSQSYTLGPHSFTSRLIIGSGKYDSFEQNLACAEASGAEMVTVALRRTKLDAPSGQGLLDFISPDRFKILPNTAGCYTAEDALATARMGRELLDTVPGRACHPRGGAHPGGRRLHGAALHHRRSRLVSAARRHGLRGRHAAGGAHRLGARHPQSGLGIRNPANLRIILETVEVPVIVDAGVGTASDAAVAMELGSTAVLMNTGIAGAKDPLRMAKAMRLAVEAGRLAYESGRMPRRLYASASSPLDGLASF